MILPRVRRILFVPQAGAPAAVGLRHHARPTADRSAFLPQAIRYFLKQDSPHANSSSSMMRR